MAGANDLPHSSTAEVLSDMQELCEKVHATNPSATVVVCGILPRTQSDFHDGKLTQSYLRRFNNTATEVNNALRQVEIEVPWMEFV
jgi:lysophospholipase L1-like esterase